MSYNPKKCVSVSSASSVCSTIWIFFKFCTKSRKNGTIWLTEPDFWFRTLFRTYCPKSVKNGRFSRFLTNLSKTTHTILMVFWYDVVLIVVHLLRKNCMSGKILVPALWRPEKSKIRLKTIPFSTRFLEVMRWFPRKWKSPRSVQNSLNYNHTKFQVDLIIIQCPTTGQSWPKS